MLKNILKLKGAALLKKEELAQINGGTHNQLCNLDQDCTGTTYTEICCYGRCLREIWGCSNAPYIEVSK